MSPTPSYSTITKTDFELGNKRLVLTKDLKARKEDELEAYCS